MTVVKKGSHTLECERSTIVVLPNISQTAVALNVFLLNENISFFIFDRKRKSVKKKILNFSAKGNRFTKPPKTVKQSPDVPFNPKQKLQVPFACRSYRSVLQPHSAINPSHNMNSLRFRNLGKLQIN